MEAFETPTEPQSRPVVSIVIPTLRRAELVQRAIRSVLDQTLREIEVIVVVDGVDAKTEQALARIDDPRFRFIVHERSLGAGQARDTGADASRGEWVAFLDDDDEWLPEKLERQVAAVPAGADAVVMTLSRVVSPNGEAVRPATVYDEKEPIDEWLFAHATGLSGGQAFLQTSSLMLPRRMFDVLHFTDTKQHEEWELVIRAVKQLGYRLVTVREPLVIHYFDPSVPSLSTKYTWDRSLAWADGLQDLITPRAYAGFCLIVTARLAANHGRWKSALPLLSAGVRKGSPTLAQFSAFVLLWMLPPRFRRWARSVSHGTRG